MGGDVRNKNKTVENEDSVTRKNMIPRNIMRFAPLFFAFFAGASVVWFNVNHKQPKKEEAVVQKTKESVPLEQIVNQGKGSKLDEAREYNVQGLLYFGQNNYAAAEASFERAVELCPNYEIALGNLFNAKFALKKFDEAISLLQRLQKVRESGFQSDLRKCYFAYAAYLLLQDDPVHAQEKIEQYFALNPEGNAFGEGANLYLKIASYYFAKDDFKNSVRVGERILELMPVEYKEECAKLHSNLAISYYGLAETTKDADYLRFTQKHIRQARELDPNDETIKDISERCERLFESIENSKK